MSKARCRGESLSRGRPLAALVGVLVFLGASPAIAESTAFVNVNVLPMTSDTVLQGMTVIVSSGRIEAIGEVDSTVVPEGASVIDGTDRYLLPGLTEMHAHVPPAPSEELDRVLTLFVVNGVTTIRGMLGHPSHLALREELQQGRRLGPRLITSGPSFNGRSVRSPEQAAEMAREQHASGYDFLKIHPGLTRAEFHAVADAAGELGIPFAGHVPEDVGLPAALEAGIATIDHLDGYMAELLPRNIDPSGGFGGFFGVLLADEAREERVVPLARATAEAGVHNVPTQALFEHLMSSADPASMAKWPEMRFMPAATVADWQAAKERQVADAPEATRLRAIDLRRRLILALDTADAGLLLGSDAPQIFNVPGFSLHRELGYLVEAGLSPYRALRAGTVSPAAYFGQGDRYGSIAVGHAADLVLLDDNPLEDIGSIRRIHGVMSGGRWIGRAEIEALLERYESTTATARDRGS